MGAKLALRYLDHRPEEMGGTEYLAYLTIAKRVDDEKPEFCDTVVYLANLMGVGESTARRAIQNLVKLGKLVDTKSWKKWPGGHGSPTPVYRLVHEACQIDTLKPPKLTPFKTEACQIDSLKGVKNPAEGCQIDTHSNPIEDKIERIDENPASLALLLFEKLHKPTSYRTRYTSWEPELRSLLPANPDLSDLLEFALVKDEFWSTAGGWLKSKGGPVAFLRNNLSKIRTAYDSYVWDNKPKGKSTPRARAQAGATAPPQEALWDLNRFTQELAIKRNLSGAEEYLNLHRAELEATLGDTLKTDVEWRINEMKKENHGN